MDLFSDIQIPRIGKGVHVVYFAKGSFGSFSTDIDKPITGPKFTDVMENMVRQIRDYPPKTTVIIISWQRFEAENLIITP